MCNHGLEPSEDRLRIVVEPYLLQDAGTIVVNAFTRESSALIEGEDSKGEMSLVDPSAAGRATILDAFR